ncbi:hypothetical protein QBC47DRAFT_378327 [Echria macrotheca]|uniref:Hydrophobin n=1 Tax=Echria macrotheca TaxID=438768 RepID=A0AAJ0BHQ8_9PEZI|nr:hypothetical protein QBC47DRAFT_378327 [Echria macrotheca]
MRLATLSASLLAVIAAGAPGGGPGYGFGFPVPVIGGGSSSSSGTGGVTGGTTGGTFGGSGGGGSGGSSSTGGSGGSGGGSGSGSGSTSGGSAGGSTGGSTTPITLTCTGLYSSLQCCATDVLGVAALDCESRTYLLPPSPSTVYTDFSPAAADRTCPSNKAPTCCVLPIVSQTACSPWARSADVAHSLDKLSSANRLNISSCPPGRMVRRV